MKGVVVIPNSSTERALIQRDDDFLMVVELQAGDRLAFMDTVSFGEMDSGFRLRVKNLTTEAVLSVSVLRIDSDLSWEEKMQMWGKTSK